MTSGIKSLFYRVIQVDSDGRRRPYHFESVGTAADCTMAGNMTENLMKFERDVNPT